MLRLAEAAQMIDSLNAGQTWQPLFGFSHGTLIVMLWLAQAAQMIDSLKPYTAYDQVTQTPTGKSTIVREKEGSKRVSTYMTLMGRRASASCRLSSSRRRWFLASCSLSSRSSSSVELSFSAGRLPSSSSRRRISGERKNDNNWNLLVLETVDVHVQKHSLTPEQ